MNLHARGSSRWAGRTLRLWVALAMLAMLISIPGVASAAWTTITETEPNDTPAQANVLPVDGTICLGSYSTTADDDWYSVALTAGQTYVFETGPNTSALDVRLDTYLYLYDTDGTTELTSDDDGGAYQYSYIQYTPSVTGTYYLMTCSFAHAYTGNYGIRARDISVSAGTGTIQGTVTDGTDPIEGITVSDYYFDPWFVQVDSGYYTDGGQVTSGPDGTYSADVGAGVHVVGFSDPSGTYFDQYYDGATDFNTAARIDLAADETTTGIDAVMVPIPPLDTRTLGSVRASVDSTGTEGYRGSRTAAISADGRYVVFYSGVAFVPEDTNNERDWYRKDLQTGEIELVSVSSNGDLANDSYSDGDGCASISADGRYVAFDSVASNLVEGDTNGYADVFVRDMVEGTTIRISAPVEGEGNDSSWNPSISADGQSVAFDSWADNLVADDTNGVRDVFVYEMETGAITRASVDAEGGERSRGSRSPAISADGWHVAFISGGDFVADDNIEGYQDVYVKDLTDGSIARANVSSAGDGANDASWDRPAISEDGQFVAFDSDADNLVDSDLNGENDIFVHDFASGETTMVSVTSDGLQSYSYKNDPAISADGRIVVFEEDTYSSAPAAINVAAEGDIVNQLVPGDVNESDDIVMHDMADGSTTMVSTSFAGKSANDGSEMPAITADGKHVAYDSWADNIVRDDTNGVRDVFVTYVRLESIEQPVQGPDRYETAIQVSQQWQSADTVVLATGDNWPDALGGSALAGVVGGPVLLTPTHELLPDVAAEIERLGASKVYVLGEFRAIDDDVFAEVEAIPGVEGAVRLGGVDRYETARLVAEEVVSLQGEAFEGKAFVATGEAFPDALGASPLAAYKGWPVYLAPHPVIADETIQAMQNAGVTDVVLLGGDAAMPEGTEVVVLAAGFNAVRIDGADRYETAAKVASYGVNAADMMWQGVALATGEKFPDALAGGAAQGQSGSVMVLTMKSSLPTPTSEVLGANKYRIGDYKFLGGTDAIAQSVRDDVASLLQ